MKDIKILKENLWNKCFHRDILAEQKAKYNQALALRGFFPEIMQRLKDCNDLIVLLNIHKDAWLKGYRNENLGPCRYGMFRTKDIMDMKPEEVFLGDIYGLWTNPITEWEQHRSDTMAGNGWGIDPNIRVYDLICGQYRRILKANIIKLRDEALAYIIDYELVNKKS